MYISADSQDDPSCLHKMLEEWHNGSDVIWALRKDRKKEPWYIRQPAQLFYRLFYSLTEIRHGKIDLSRADFFLLDKTVVNAINACSERNTWPWGLIAWLGFNQSYVEYQRRERLYGKSTWSFRKRLRVTKNCIAAFSGLPLKMASSIGILFAILGIMGAIYVVLDKLFFSNVIPGWASIIVLVLVLGGVQLTILGIIGEYLWRNLEESRKRPLFFIERKTGINKNINKKKRS